MPVSLRSPPFLFILLLEAQPGVWACKKKSRLKVPQSNRHDPSSKAPKHVFTSSRLQRHAAVDATGANKIEIIEARWLAPHTVLVTAMQGSRIRQRLYTVILDLNRADVVCHAENVVGSTMFHRRNVTRSPVLEGHSRHRRNLHCTYPSPPGSWKPYGQCRDHVVPCCTY